jgi:hypothetical protein
MNRSSQIVPVVTLVLLGVVGSAHAQDTAPVPAAVAPAPATAEAQAGQPAGARRWHGTFNAGLGLAGGAQAQRGYQISASLSRAFSDKGRFVANFSHDYQRVTFPEKAVLSDRLSAGIGVDHSITRNTVAMVRSLYLSDEQLHVNARFEELAGYGLHVFNADKRYELYLIPGVSVFKQDLSYSDILDWEVGFGFYQKLVAKFNDAWSLEETFRFRDNVTDDDRSIESGVQLHGAFTRSLGVQFEYQFNLETIVPPGYPSYLQVLSVGLRFQF